MYSWVNLVVISSTLGYLANGLDSSDLDIRNRDTADFSTVPLFNSPDSRTPDRLSRKLKRPIPTKIRQSTPSANLLKKKSTLANGSVGMKNNKGAKNAVAIVKTNKLALIHDLIANPKTELERRDKKKRHKRKMSRVLMAMLMAYKIKFAALVPTMLGGLALLVSTTALAGFFFALFAAVLGLKGQ